MVEGIRICDECGQVELYCIDCDAWHHQDSYAIEHKEYQEQLKKEPKQ